MKDHGHLPDVPKVPDVKGGRDSERAAGQEQAALDNTRRGYHKPLIGTGDLERSPPKDRNDNGGRKPGS